MNTYLITSGTSALAQRVSTLLPQEQFFFADSGSVSFLKGKKYKAIPREDQNAFVHEVLKLCLDLSVNILIPLGMLEMEPLARNRVLFEEYGIIIALPELGELAKVPKVKNPNRQDFPEIFIQIEPQLKGVFTRLNNGELGLCCVK